MFSVIKIFTVKCWDNNLKRQYNGRKRAKILPVQSRAKKKKTEEDKNLQETCGAGQYVYVLLMCNNSVVILWLTVFSGLVQA